LPEHVPFAWQGFELNHPDDWAPVHLSGTRAEGYARIASSGLKAFQIRWKTARSAPDLQARLRLYFERLSRDAAKAREAFKREITPEGDALDYRWKGAGQGRGAILYSEACRRVFFLEVVGGRKDSLLPLWQQLRSSFVSRDDAMVRWTLFGLDVRIPSSLKLERNVMQAGRTQLSFVRRGSSVEATRWAFGQRLIQRHGFEQWLRALTRMPKATVEVEEYGLRMASGSIFGRVEVLAKHDSEADQITVLLGRGRNSAYTPDWDWFV
jgi:hypothetical protein